MDLLLLPLPPLSGELDEQELVCVLKDVGFEEEEARIIYKQVGPMSVRGGGRGRGTHCHR